MIHSVFRPFLIIAYYEQEWDKEKIPKQFNARFALITYLLNNTLI